MGGRSAARHAAAQAEQQERERQQRIKDATDKINDLFNNPARAQLYEKQRSAVLELNRDNIARQFAEASRDNRFHLARTGMSGGSLDIDSHAELNRQNNEGLVRAAQLADNAAAQLRADDERTRANLINMAQSGINSTQAQQMAANQAQANAAAAAANANAATVGDLFGRLRDGYRLHQYNSGYNSYQHRPSTSIRASSYQGT